MTLYAANISSSYVSISDDFTKNENQFYSFLLTDLIIDAVEIGNSQISIVYFSNTPVENFNKSSTTRLRVIQLSHQKESLIHLYSLQNLDINFSKTDIIFPFHYFL